MQKEEPQKGSWRQSTTVRQVQKARPLAEVESSQEERILTYNSELDRVLGGGIVPGSLVLIGGEPGIGKSTLMLQVALSIPKIKVLYVSGEESASQIKMRAERLTNTMNNCHILTETSTQNIFSQIEDVAPGLVIIDSIQTMASSFLDSSAGSVSQVRECAAEIMRYAKESQVPVFLIGHITKDGSIAGPKVLEHMVDTVLQFEGDRHLSYRLLRTTKNRFGNTSELGIYEMNNSGLRCVENPSEILISQRDFPLSGVAIAVMLEGQRPLLVEIQALVGTSTYSTPQRSSTGFDAKRLNMILAVLEKRSGFRFGNQDVFLNIAGGIAVEDPAVDLAVAMALVSSLQDLPIPDSVCFAAEVGLGGEIRASNRIEQRIAEADKLGYKKIFLSKFSLKSFEKNTAISVVPVSALDEVFRNIFANI